MMMMMMMRAKTRPRPPPEESLQGAAIGGGGNLFLYLLVSGGHGKGDVQVELADSEDNGAVGVRQAVIEDVHHLQKEAGGWGVRG